MKTKPTVNFRILRAGTKSKLKRAEIMMMRDIQHFGLARHRQTRALAKEALSAFRMIDSFFSDFCGEARSSLPLSSNDEGMVRIVKLAKEDK